MNIFNFILIKRCFDALGMYERYVLMNYIGYTLVVLAVMAAELTTALPPFVLPHFVVHKIARLVPLKPLPLIVVFAVIFRLNFVVAVNKISYPILANRLRGSRFQPLSKNVR
jgi:ABC-type multidrug transport system fused ATPase/permease subunit